MVYYFKAKVSDEYEDKVYDIYMGKDKIENDPLIKHSNPRNLWFHVDKHSSAHLYLDLKDEERMKKFEDLQLEDELVDQVAQLTKTNSIKGNKLNNVTIIYTPVDNLISDGSMDIGTVTFKNAKKIKRVNVSKKDNTVLNKLNKTKTEITTDKFIDNEKKAIIEYERNKREYERQITNEEKELTRQYQEQKQRNKDPYGDLFTEENMKGSDNLTILNNYEEDFM